MRKEDLQAKIESFLATLDDTEDNEWYTTPRRLAEDQLSLFVDHIYPVLTASSVEAEYRVPSKLPGYGLTEWLEEVKLGKTILGYWEWLAELLTREQG